MSIPLLLTALAAVAAEPGYRLETRPARRVTATLTFEAQADKLEASEWIVFAAAAPATAGQSHVRSRMEPAGKVVAERSELERPVLFARVPGRGQLEKSLTLKVQYEATLWSRRLLALTSGERSAKVEQLSLEDRKAALRSAGDLVHEDENLKHWQAKQMLVRRSAESDIAFARRAFSVIRQQFAYDYRPEMDRTPAAVCQTGKSDCGGLSNLLVAVLRSQGIPARTLAGRWAMSAEPGQTLNGFDYHQYHVKAEFFAAGVGWIPMDMASGILHDRSTEGLHYFGRDDGDFITQHIDGSLELDTVHFGRQTLPTLQRPAFWVTGKGSLDGVQVVDGWTVTSNKP
jgi:transglutaminase-like putative cysteine protease